MQQPLRVQGSSTKAPEDHHLRVNPKNHVLYFFATFDHYLRPKTLIVDLQPRGPALLWPTKVP